MYSFVWLSAFVFMSVCIIMNLSMCALSSQCACGRGGEGGVRVYVSAKIGSSRTTCFEIVQSNSS